MKLDIQDERRGVHSRLKAVAERLEKGDILTRHLALALTECMARGLQVGDDERYLLAKVGAEMDVLLAFELADLERCTEAAEGGEDAY